MIGQTFTRDGASFRVVGEYAPGVYECRGPGGEIVIPGAEIRAYQLKDAARASFARMGTHGRTPDPLRALIPGDGEADPDTLATVEAITGRPVAGVNLAPAARSALRRWAARTETTH